MEIGFVSRSPAPASQTTQMTQIAQRLKGKKMDDDKKFSFLI